MTMSAFYNYEYVELVPGNTYWQILSDILAPTYGRIGTFYARGNLDLLNECMVGIVGARAANQRGREAAYKIGKFFAQAGHVVVSGGAYGVDEYAHTGATDIPNWYNTTIAVLASEVGVPTKVRNFPLLMKILSNGGLLLSPYSEGEGTPKRYYFRDQIIAGMSSLLIPVQCAKDSGTMHTVNAALRYQVPVWCPLMPASDRSLDINEGFKIILGRDRHITPKKEDLRASFNSEELDLVQEALEYHYAKRQGEMVAEHERAIEEEAIAETKVNDLIEAVMTDMKDIVYYGYTQNLRGILAQRRGVMLSLHQYPIYTYIQQVYDFGSAATYEPERRVRALELIFKCGLDIPYTERFTAKLTEARKALATFYVSDHYR